MVDDVKKADLARQERLRQQAQETGKPKEKLKESDFDKLVKQGQTSQAGQMAKESNKPVTERAMEEAAKRHERQQEMREKEKEERKEKRESRETGEKADPRVAQQKVVGKGSRGQGGRGSAGSGQGGYGGSTAKRGLAKKLTRAGVKTLPAELHKKFASKMAQAAKEAGRPDTGKLAQEVLDKVVQYVRIGINRKGEKEIRLDLHQKIFRGLKLSVIEREGKVSVQFTTADEKGRAVFEKNSDAIRDALSKKGIDVGEITVV